MACQLFINMRIDFLVPIKDIKCYTLVKGNLLIAMDYPMMIKLYREKFLISQTDLAEKLNVSYVTVNRWENGHYEPTLRCKRELNKSLRKPK